MASFLSGQPKEYREIANFNLYTRKREEEEEEKYRNSTRMCLLCVWQADIFIFHMLEPDTEPDIFIFIGQEKQSRRENILRNFAPAIPHLGLARSKNGRCIEQQLSHTLQPFRRWYHTLYAFECKQLLLSVCQPVSPFLSWPTALCAWAERPMQKRSSNGKEATFSKANLFVENMSRPLI